jgi:hypothetical protein
LAQSNKSPDCNGNKITHAFQKLVDRH